ncbi:SAM-dependent methyltransferase [Actinomadura kijaniata]|uniref:SAM-dependent methyltransferase n=1 Tax=Actinomadura kijaniata TaxID=46161 RepID=UPI003F1D8EAD
MIFGAPAARRNREFLGRAVRMPAEPGIRRFADVGAGPPTRENVHEVMLRARSPCGAEPVPPGLEPDFTTPSHLGVVGRVP